MRAEKKRAGTAQQGLVRLGRGWAAQIESRDAGWAPSPVCQLTQDIKHVINLHQPSSSHILSSHQRNLLFSILLLL